MENLAERQTLYQEILNDSFDQIARQLPKNQKHVVQQFTDMLKEDTELNANKYFAIYKAVLASKDQKLISISLDALDKLINTGFLDGNCDETPIVVELDKSKEGDKSPNNNSKEPKKKLIDVIIEVVCAVKREKNEDIYLQLINVLTILATKLKHLVHGTNLQKIVETLTAVYTVSKSQANQNSAKTSLKLIVTTVFQQVDKGEQLQGADLSKTKSKDKKGEIDISFTEPNRTISHRLSPDTTQTHGVPNVQEPEDILKEATPKATEEPKVEENREVSESKEDGRLKSNEKDALFKNYMERFVTNLVDDVCIYNAKVESVVKKYEEKDESEREPMQQELKDIPIKAIPLASDVDDPKYKVLKKAKVENEHGTLAGVFGWCIICRNTAGLFCKDTKVPVCSLECKFKHLEQADFLSNKGDVYNPKSLEAIQDAYQVFGYLCRVSNKEQGKDSPSELMRTKALALELLLTAMANPSTIFSSRKEFRDSIREYLCTSVLKNSLSTDRTIFSYSLGIFNSLVNHFREFLKPEMILFIEKIFFNMLESTNSTYNHRMSALQVFYKICSKANIVLDFYVNYDCDMESTNIVERMVELLCKIAQGKYSKAEYVSVVQPAQDQNLRFIALGALVNLVKALVLFTEDYNRQITTATPTKKTVTADDNKDEDDKEAEAEAIKNVAFEKMDEIGRSRWFKNELQKAVQKFNFKIKNGMRMFNQLGVLNPTDAKSIAKFFKKTPSLSKEKLGEYFGEEAELHVQVLTEYTDLLDFRNKTLDDALRVFLEHFILPGEGQKIDRIVQVFAGKYFKDNPKSYNSATAAYTLSFLFIMLQTDAHNVNIKPEEKMKVNNFVSLARGINDGKDLPAEELTGYYNRILQHPLALHDADKAKKMIQEAQGVSAKKKEEQFKLESDKMIKEGQKMIRGVQSGHYHTVRNTECIKPLFHEVVWSPVLAVFSVLLEQSEDPNMIQSCLEGFANCIILTGLHNLSMERDTFVSSLAKFTNILTVREIKEKNIKCIRLLLDLAANRGHLLRTSWRFVLECIIWIEYYFHYSPHTHSNRAGDVANKGNKGQANEALEQIEYNNSEIIQQIVDVNLVNVIFSKSSTFDIEEVIDFITCLCEISKEELRTKGTNIYCLQKLVEVAHFNMDGIKFVWAKIWSIMREHLSYVALNSKPEVSLFAIDSLKQLSIKFLSKKELGLLEFQKDFLKPFEIIFQRTKGEDIKELILGCCNYIILHTRKDLKSGWKTIIDILGLTADSEDGHLTKIAFSITESILQEDVKSLVDLVGDFTILLLKFAKSKKSDIAEVSLRHLKTFLQQIITPDTDNGTKTQEPKEELEEQNVTTMEEPTLEQNLPIHGLTENTWITILTSIITLASDSSAKIQTQSTMLLFDLLDQYGAGFPINFWGMVLSGVIKPLFDEIQYSLPSASSRNSEKAGAFKEFYGKAFERFIDLFNIFSEKLSQFNEELLNILLNCIQNQSQIISRVGINALRYMIFKDAGLRRRGLDLVFELYRRLCATTPLAQALNADSGETKGEGEEEIEREVKNVDVKKDMSIVEYKGIKLVAADCDVQCKVQLLLVRIIKDTLDQFFGGFEDQQINQLKNILQVISKLARRFNEQSYLRHSLAKCGFMKDRENKEELPDLLEQEQEALASYGMILFRLYTERKDMEQEKALGEFLDMGVQWIKSFKSRNEELLNLSKRENRRAEGAEGDEVEDRRPVDEVEGRLKKASLEKEILVMREILYSEFLSKLVKIEPRELKDRLKEVTKCIIDGVICFIPKESEDYTEVLRTILNRYFEFCYERVEE